PFQSPYQQAQPYEQPQQQTSAFEQPHAYQKPRPTGRSSTLPVGAYDRYDDFDNYDAVPDERPPGRARRALLVTAGVAVLVVAVAAGLAFSGKIHVLGIGAKPVPTVGFSPSGTDAGSDATQTGTAF